MSFELSELGETDLDLVAAGGVVGNITVITPVTVSTGINVAAVTGDALAVSVFGRATAIGGGLLQVNAIGH